MQRPILRKGQGPEERQGHADGLVRPVEWGRPRWNIRASISIVLAAVVSVVAFVGGLSSDDSDLGPESRFFLILSALMLLTAAFGCVFWWPRRGSPGVRTLRRGGLGAATEIRSRLSVFVALVAMVGCAAALAVGAAVEVFLFNNGIPWVSLVLALLGVPCVAFVVEVALGRLAVGALVLSPDGIRQRGWSFESYLPGCRSPGFGHWITATRRRGSRERRRRPGRVAARARCSGWTGSRKRRGSRSTRGATRSTRCCCTGSSSSIPATLRRGANSALRGRSRGSGERASALPADRSFGSLIL